MWQNVTLIDVYRQKKGLRMLDGNNISYFHKAGHYQLEANKSENHRTWWDRRKVGEANPTNCTYRKLQPCPSVQYTVPESLNNERSFERNRSIKT